MNLIDSSFLCIDLGSSAVRGMGIRITSAKISKSAIASIESSDTTFALRQVIDELEEKLGSHFDSAFVTGNFGHKNYSLKPESVNWNTEHRISELDVLKLAENAARSIEGSPLHVIPLRYDTPSMRNLATPIGQIDTSLSAVFGILTASPEILQDITTALRSAHLQVRGFFDPMFLLGESLRDESENTIIIDFGASRTGISLWTARGPIKISMIPIGGKDFTRIIAENFNLPFAMAERIKKNCASVIPTEIDRFAPADSRYDFSRSDVNEIFMPMFSEIMDLIESEITQSIEKYAPTKIIVTGGGGAINGLGEYLQSRFKIDTEITSPDSAVQSCANYIWRNQASAVKAYLVRKSKMDSMIPKLFSVFHKRKRHVKSFIPIMPSTLAFDMTNQKTFDLFTSGGISMIHVDIMDGFYVGGIAGSIDELKQIRSRTNAHLHVHLMTESPIVWSERAVIAGADTIIVSTGTYGVRSALRKIKEMGKRCGIALHPETSVGILKPIIKEIDEILVMAVIPGKSGQEFIMDTVSKIRAPANTRKKYDLKFKISVDGGINPEIAKMCWDAGADFLISGAFLASSADFPVAVQSLINK